MLWVSVGLGSERGAREDGKPARARLEIWSNESINPDLNPKPTKNRQKSFASIYSY